MATATAFRVLFESSIKRSEKKVAGPTVSLLREILTNAGMDEGEWSLRDSRRIKKKGRERFHAIRIEERSGRKSVRIWCKPGGNDSCFEYSLLPPAEVDTNVLFGLLRRVHPVNLEIPESNDLPRAFINHVVDFKPRILSPLVLRGDSAAKEPCEFVGAEDPPHDMDSSAEAEIREAVRDLDLLERGSPPQGIAQAVAKSKESMALFLDDPVLMSDQEVMDKALLTLSIVAPNGYAKKNEASSSIIENLGIKRFVKEVSGGTYTSVEGAMRALTMALRSSGYLERVHYAAENGGVSKAIKGYKLTHKATKRISALKAVGNLPPSATDSLDERPELEREEADNLRTDRFVEKIACDTRENFLHEVYEGEREDGDYDLQIGDDLPRLKGLIARHEEADLQLKEIEGILGNLDSEIADIELDATGLELAEREKMKQMEILQGEIHRAREKRATIEANLERKRRERKEWEDMKSPHLSEKSKVEAEICAITGRNKK